MLRPRFLLGDDPFPDPAKAGPDGLLAVGGDLSSKRLLDAYRRGIFPWYEDGLPILWFSPDPRLVLVPSELRVGRSLRKTIRRAPFAITLDTAFDAVIRACADATRPGQDGTWITADMIAAYTALHRAGWAHSAETWREGRLVGGVYGVAVGAVFCGESMFAAENDASKVAFVSLTRWLAARGFELIDCQVRTEHLERFGAREWSRASFLKTLRRLVDRPSLPGPWVFEEA